MYVLVDFYGGSLLEGGGEINRVRKNRMQKISCESKQKKLRTADLLQQLLSWDKSSDFPPTQSPYSWHEICEKCLGRLEQHEGKKQRLNKNRETYLLLSKPGNFTTYYTSLYRIYMGFFSKIEFEENAYATLHYQRCTCWKSTEF